MREAARSLPEPGAEFLGFHLVEELGRGAFGRVFLARQGDLAERPVVLKVSADLPGEAQTLAQALENRDLPVDVRAVDPFLEGDVLLIG